MTKNIGTPAAWTQISKGSHNWAFKMNEQIIKYGALIQGAAKSRTDALPGSGSPGDVYIHPTNDRIYVWVEEYNDGETVHPAEWYYITPTTGVLMLVIDENKWYCYTHIGEWQMVWDPALSHRAIKCERSFYAPYLIRPSKTIFSYVSTQEFVIPAGAAGSGAFCEVAPTGGSVTYNLVHQGSSQGTIVFAAGSTDGVVTVPSDIIVLPAVMENMYTQARVLTVVSPANTRGMEGLNVTLQGKIRSID